MLRCRSAFLSDVHLGTREAKTDYLRAFFNEVECDYLYLVGDILDLWKIHSGLRWHEESSAVVRQIIDMAARGTRVFYLPGNHDEGFREFTGGHLFGVAVRRSLIHSTADRRRILVTHGDAMDCRLRHNRLLHYVGDSLYEWLLGLSHSLHGVRRRLGLNRYWSLVSEIKRRVGNAQRYIDRFEALWLQEARVRQLDGVICGHIHQPALRRDGDLLYMNTGDWVEHCTVLLEDHRGVFSLFDWPNRRELARSGAPASPIALPTRKAAA